MKAIDWVKRPGESLPAPVIVDDSDRYPAELVKDVRAWLQREKPGFSARRPSNTLLNMVRDVQGGPIRWEITYGISLDCMAAGTCGQFRPTTVEFVHADLGLRYRYLAAVTERNGWPRFILGPCLGVLPPVGGGGDQVLIAQQVEQVMVHAAR